MKSFSKIFDSGSISISFLASLLALLQFKSKRISAFVGFRKIFWQNNRQ
jgi:hypothetical protein